MQSYEIYSLSSLNMIQTIDLPQYGSSSAYVRDILNACRGQYILLNISGRDVTITPEAADRMKECADSSGAGMLGRSLQ